jgi:hypothetical protein
MKLSRSRITRFLAVMASAILTTSFLLVPAGSASAADTTTPALTSFSVSATQVIPGQQLTFRYVATEASGSLKSLGLSYFDGYRRERTLTFDGPLPVAGAVTITIPDTWMNGIATMQTVRLIDPSGNQITYSRDGSFSVSPGATPPVSPFVPLAPGDLTLSGSTVNVTVPSLTSVSVSGSPATPGQSIRIHYDAADASGSLTRVSFRFRDQYQLVRGFTSTSTDPLPLSGFVDLAIPATWPNGPYVLDVVDLTSLPGHSSSYFATGRLTVTPAGADSPTTHTLDLKATSFTVVGSQADFTPPALTSFGVTGSPMLRDGTATVSYTATSRDPLQSVTLTYTDPLGSGHEVAFKTTTDQLAGTLPVTFPLGSLLGNYSLTRISLVDTAGDRIDYWRDGRTFQSPNPVYGWHTLDLTALDVLMVSPPSAPNAVSARARSGSATVFWTPTDGQSTPVSGYTITAQPGGKTMTTGGTVINNGEPTSAQMTGLTNGTTYRFTISATNAFGVGPASSPSAAVTPMMSTNVFAAGDFNRDGHPDLIALKPSPNPFDLDRPSYLYRGNGIGGFGWTTRMSAPFGSADRTVFSPGDFSGDGVPDVMMTNVNGTLRTANGDGHGDIYWNLPTVGYGWGSMRFVFGPGDFSGDAKADVLAVNSTGGLYLYRGNGRGGWASAGQKIGIGWGGFLTVFSRGDFSGDGKNDILAVSKDGGLYLYRGDGAGGFAAAGQRIGNGWGGFLSVFSPGDFSGDHKTDVIAMNTAGTLLLYKGNGRGGFAAAGQSIGKGWAPFR